MFSKSFLSGSPLDTDMAKEALGGGEDLKIYDSNGDILPRGKYISVTVSENDKNKYREILKTQLSALLPEKGLVLFIGVGNEDVTIDSFGPKMINRIAVTNMLDIPESSAHKTAAFAAPVFAKSGIESAELAAATAAALKPAAAVIFDSLAAKEPQNLCRVFQLTDCGIRPGSGASRHAKEISQNTLGCPVITLGVPTVIRAEVFLSGAGKDASGSETAERGGIEKESGVSNGSTEHSRRKDHDFSGISSASGENVGLPYGSTTDDENGRTSTENSMPSSANSTASGENNDFNNLMLTLGDIDTQIDEMVKIAAGAVNDWILSGAKNS